MSSDGKLSIPLEARYDNEGRVYFVAKLKGPFSIDCKEGVAFLCFISEKGNEEIQICSMTPPKGKDK